jgi:hypothetical protein
VRTPRVPGGQPYSEIDPSDEQGACLLRKVAIVLLAMPVVATLYIRVALRRSIAARVALVFGMGALLSVAGVGALAPARTSATPSGADPTPLPNAAFETHLQTGHGLRDAVAIQFSSPMDAASVAAALTIVPDAAVRLTWDAAGQRLTVAPFPTWSAETYYVVSVGAGALDRSGRTLDAPARAAFLTRGPTHATLAAEPLAAGRVAPDGEVTAVVPNGIDPVTLAAALRITPAVVGDVTATARPNGAAEAVFVPRTGFAPDTTYTLSLAPGTVDTDGIELAVAPLTFRTSAAPTVVRFRPVGSQTDVARTAVLSVRFDQAMDRSSTQAAFTATVAGTKVAGTAHWYEGDTVLALTPKTQLPAGAKVTLAVAASARSAAGVPIAGPRAITFTTIAPPKPAPKPAAKPAPKPAAKPAPKPAPSPGGSVAGSSWSAVEAYYKRLLDCTRGGGLVTSSGSCSSPGGSGLVPLKLDAGLTTKLARPYAKLLATTNQCSHFVNGSLATRLSAAGYHGFTWAGENLGCQPYEVYRSVLNAHLFFQSERSYNGGHWRNMMDPRFRLVGIGVWVYHGQVRLVTDFLAP